MISQIANINAKNFKYKFEDYSLESDFSTTIDFQFAQLENLTKQIDRINLEDEQNFNVTSIYKTESNFDLLQTELKQTLEKIAQLVKKVNILTQTQQEIYQKYTFQPETKKNYFDISNKTKIIAISLGLLFSLALYPKLAGQNSNFTIPTPTEQQTKQK